MRYLGILLALLMTGCAVNGLPVVTVPQPLIEKPSESVEDNEIGEPAYDPWQMWHDHSVFTTCVVSDGMHLCAFHLCAPDSYFPNGVVKRLAGHRSGIKFKHSYYFMRCQNVSNELKHKLKKFLKWKTSTIGYNDE